MTGKTKQKRQAYWIIFVIAATLVFSSLAIYFGSRTSKREPQQVSKLVRTLVVEEGEKRAEVFAYGSVQADREVSLRSEVSGRVIEKSQNLVTGGIVTKGEMLLRLDPRDYINAVEQAKASVENASFELELEKGRQIVAKREWEQLGPTIKSHEFSEGLALRKPHLREKEAAYKAALSALEKANIDLERTMIKSPLNAIVLTIQTEVGDYVTTQTELAKIAATDVFQIQVSVPLNKLSWIRMPHGSDPGSSVSVIQDTGGSPVVRAGRIQRLQGDLDPNGRMARILIAVDDPLGLENGKTNSLPLLIGSYVRVQFEGPLLQGVFVIPREALRENNTVWVKNDSNELEIREVHVVQKLDGTVIIDQGLKTGEEIIITPLPLAIQGMKLRTQEEQKEGPEGGADAS